MTPQRFRILDSTYRVKNPKLFHLSSPDQPASEVQIEQVEKLLGIQLPETYRWFLQEFGGGDFGLLTIYSADPRSDWYLPKRYAEANAYLPSNLLPISDDFAGGHYALKIVERRALERVFYWNLDGGQLSTEHENVLAFVAQHAYDPQ